MPTLNARLFLVGTTLASASLAYSGSQPLSLEECREKTLAHNLSLQRLKQQIGGSQAEVSSARAGYLPKFTSSATVSQRGSHPSPADVSNDRTLTGRLSVPLFSGFKTQFQVEKAKAELQKSEHSLAAGELSALYEVERAYHALYYQQKNLALSQLIQERLKKQLTLMELKYQSGHEPKWAVAKAEADLQEAGLETVRADDKRRSAQQELKVLMGEPSSPDSFIASSDYRFPTISPQAADADHLIMDHPELKSLEAALSAAEKNLKVEQASYWPEIAAAASYQRNVLPSEERPQGSWTLSLEATLPLFAPSIAPAIEKATAAKSIALISLDERRHQLQAELATALRSYHTSLKARAIAQAKLTAAEQRVFTIDQEYSAGLRSFVEWEQAQQQLIQAEKALLSANLSAAEALDLVTFKSARKLP